MSPGGSSGISDPSSDKDKGFDLNQVLSDKEKLGMWKQWAFSYKYMTPDNFTGMIYKEVRPRGLSPEQICEHIMYPSKCPLSPSCLSDTMTIKQQPLI